MYKLNNEIFNIIKKFKYKPNNILVKINKLICISGRIVSKRSMGINIFLNIQDIKGNIQILVNKNIINKKYFQITKNIKLGDLILIKGSLFKTKTKELTIKCKYIKILVKTKKTFPDKYHKIKNIETQFRKRYLDLIINNKTKNNFLIRIKIIKYIRKYLTKNKFLEVETPMLHIIPGGATAKPFKTYHKYLNTKMYLRISPEIFLKKLIIGGFTKIFELNRNFRNEGISKIHNPEFTMIEIYKAYSNYKDMMKLTKNIINYIILYINKYKTIFKFKKHNINFYNKYYKMSIKKAIFKYSNYFKNIKELNNTQKIKKIAKKLKINYKKNNIHEIINKIFKLTTEKKIIKPTFITNYPINISPLALNNKKNNKIADRFELFINGYEIANGFSELNNYKEQKKRFKNQIKKNKKKKYDKEYIEALKHGLPPTAGVGIGIDRLIMLLTNNKSIKNIIYFPTLKNK